MDKYEKICIESNPDYNVFYGAGKYFASAQNSLLHYDDALSVSYMCHCSGTIKIEGKPFSIKNGDVVITNPGEIHCCSMDDGIYHERISVSIYKTVLNHFNLKCDNFFDFLEQRPKGTGNVIPSNIASDLKLGDIMFQILLLSKTKNNKNRILCVCKILELLNQLSIAVSDSTIQTTGYAGENSIISKTIEYVNKYFTTDIDCSEIAQKLFISKYRLEHLFKENVGISLWEYVIIKRLLLVNQLIQDKHSVETAAREAGFHNYSNFYRLYKKHFNYTPIEYKRFINSKMLTYNKCK